MDKKFSVVENGKIIEYEIVKLCKNKGINYIIYKNNEEYYASRYNILNNEIVLDEINDDSEWDFIDKCLGDNYE